MATADNSLFTEPELRALLAREAPEQAARKNARGAIAKNAIPAAHNGREPAWLIERATAILSYFSKHPFLKNEDCREMLDLWRDAALPELQWLVQEGYLSMEGAHLGACYLPGPALKRAGE